jgi:hypothetical protein
MKPPPTLLVHRLGICNESMFQTYRSGVRLCLSPESSIYWDLWRCEPCRNTACTSHLDSVTFQKPHLGCEIRIRDCSFPAEFNEAHHMPLNDMVYGIISLMNFSKRLLIWWVTEFFCTSATIKKNLIGNIVRLRRRSTHSEFLTARFKDKWVGMMKDATLWRMELTMAWATLPELQASYLKVAGIHGSVTRKVFGSVLLWTNDVRVNIIILHKTNNPSFMLGAESTVVTSLET